MIDFELGDALLALQHRVRDFVDALIPREPEVTGVPAALEGNIHMLEQITSRAPRKRYLEPLARGEVRSLEIASRYAMERTSFGRTLAEHQWVQNLVADSRIEIHAARLMIWHAAWLLDRSEQARAESSMATEAWPFRNSDGPSEVHRGASARRALRQGAQR